MTLADAITLIDHPPLRNYLAKSTGDATAYPSPTRWADLGCGSGLFTLALAQFLAPGSTIDAIDLRPGIRQQTTPGGVTIRPRTADFTRDDLAPGGRNGIAGLDGILMANSLHYVRDKTAFLARIKEVPALLLVEYDTDRPVARWVPYPVSFATASALFAAAGRQNVQKLGTRPSAFGRAELYGALAQIYSP